MKLKTVFPTDKQFFKVQSGANIKSNLVCLQAETHTDFIDYSTGIVVASFPEHFGVVHQHFNHLILDNKIYDIGEPGRWSLIQELYNETKKQRSYRQGCWI